MTKFHESIIDRVASVVVFAMVVPPSPPRLIRRAKGREMVQDPPPPQFFFLPPPSPNNLYRDSESINETLSHEMGEKFFSFFFEFTINCQSSISSPTPR